MDCSPPGSSVRGDSPGKNTGVGSHAFLQSSLPSFRGSSLGIGPAPPKSTLAAGFFTTSTTWEAQIGKSKIIIIQSVPHCKTFKRLIIFHNCEHQVCSIFVRATKSPVWYLYMGDGLVVENLPANAGESHLILGLGRSPGRGNGNLLQYSYLGSHVDRGALKATAHGVKKSRLGDQKTTKISRRNDKPQHKYILRLLVPVA